MRLPIVIQPFNPLQIPQLNTAVLLTSGERVTWAHHRLLGNNATQITQGLLFTLLIGIYYTALQAYECILSHINPIYTPHPTSSRSISKLYSLLHLAFQSHLFPSGFPTKTLHAPLLSPVQATFPAHLILLHLLTRIIFGDECWSLSSSLRSFLHSTVNLSLLSPNILFSFLLSNTLSLRSSFNMSDQVSHT